MQEFVDQFDVGVLFGRFLVETLHLGALVVGQTCNVSVQLGADGVPLSLVDAVGLWIVDGENQTLGLVEGCLPGRVDACTHRKAHLLVGASQRIVGNLVAAGGKIHLADSLYLLYRYVDGLGTVLVEGDKLAAHKVVGHFLFQCTDGGYGVVGVVAVRPFVDGGCCRVVFGLHLLVEGSLGFGNIGHRNLGGLRSLLSVLRSPFKYALCGAAYGGTVVALAQVGQRYVVGTVKYAVGVLKRAAKPLRGCNDLVDTYLAIVVSIHQAQRLCVKLQPFYRAAEHGPQLLVQLAKMGDILARIDCHAGNSAD